MASLYGDHGPTYGDWGALYGTEPAPPVVLPVPAVITETPSLSTTVTATRTATVIDTDTLASVSRLTTSPTTTTITADALGGTVSLLVGWYFVPDSIPSDGSVDVTAALNGWIAGLPNGTGPNDIKTYAFSDHTLTGKLFRVDGILLAESKQYVHFEGCGSTFKRITHNTHRDFPHIRFHHCHNFAYNNMNVVGEAPPASSYDSTLSGAYDATLEAQHAFNHYSSTDSTSTGCSATQVWGDGLNFEVSGFTPADVWSSNHTVTGFTTGITHRDPVVITSGDNITFTNCTFGVTPRTGVDLEPNGSLGGATDITFQSCTWGFHRFNLCSATASGAGDVSRITFNNCHSLGAPFFLQAGDNILPGLRADWTITNCTGNVQAGGPSGALMAFYFCSGAITVTGNTNSLQPGRTPPMRIARFDTSTTANATITYSGNTPDLG